MKKCVLVLFDYYLFPKAADSRVFVLFCSQSATERRGADGVYYDIPGYGVFRRTRALCVPSKGHAIRTRSDWTSCNHHSVLFSRRSFSIRGVDGVLVLIQHADAYVHLRGPSDKAHSGVYWTPVGVLE